MYFGFLQHASGDFNHIIQTAGRLHGRCRRHYRHNHQHHINRRAGGLQTETERQYCQTDTAEHTQADTAHLGAGQDAQQHHGKLNKKLRMLSKEAHYGLQSKLMYAKNGAEFTKLYHANKTDFIFR